MKILLVDDEHPVCVSVSDFLCNLGHEVIVAKDGEEGLSKFHRCSFDLVITDIRMPKMDGLQLLRQLKEVERSPTAVIVITGHGDMDNAIMALKYGAYDYLHKPIDIRELAVTIDRLCEYLKLQNSYESLVEEFDNRVARTAGAIRQGFEQLRSAYLAEVGLDQLCIFSQSMRRVIDQVEKYSADRDISILIEGESGTGKELIARYLHYYAASKSPLPFVAINCGAISHSLFEGELFGHEQGAFTGATQKGRIGKIESANTGTLFLDEISELPLKLQVKLLRVIEEKKLYRLGGVKEIPLDIRFIAATNRDLRQEVKRKRFRLDLFYRINVGNIHIPPLRDRKEDIIPLANHFLSQAFRRRGRYFHGFTREAEDSLLSFGWPGNVRQLRNIIERLSIFSTRDKISDSDIHLVIDEPDECLGHSEEMPILGRSDFDLPENHLDFDEIKRQIISKSLKMHSGNKTGTARYLGMSLRVLQRHLRNLGFTPSDD